MTARTIGQQCWLLTYVFFFHILAVVFAANNSSIASIWPDLATVPEEPKRDGISYNSGGLLFGVCCNLALREAVHMVNGQMEFVPGQTLLHGDIEVFRNDESPCTG
jgi:hypothetical protein